MPTRNLSLAVPRTEGWTKSVRSSALHAISLAITAVTTAWARAAQSRSAGPQRGAEIDRLRIEIALLEEELELKDARWARVHPHRRPFYGPIQRMRILELRAARGWTRKQTAGRFLVTEETIASWVRRLDDVGEESLVRLGEPVNKFPDFVAYMVRRLKVLCPSLGKVRIAQILARAGLHLGASTVGRMLRRDLSKDDVAAEEPARARGRSIRAKYPNHVWHVDLTTVPTNAGFWVPWVPLARVLRWPFCWWTVIAVDHVSRLVVGFAVFARRPTSSEVCAFLNRAIAAARAKPKHIITDKGKEFFCDPFKSWCRSRGIRPRFGAVGKHGSIVIVERFIRSMKTECTRRILVPLRMHAMRRQLASYAAWYNSHRPHTALGGRTPLEVYRGAPPANEAARFEPRPRWPRGSGCARPAVRIRGKPGVGLTLRLSRFENRSHLPVVALRRAA